MMPACVCDLCPGATYTPSRLFHWKMENSVLLSFSDEFYKRKGQILFLSSFINQFYVLVMTTIMVAMMPILLLVGDGDVMRVVLSTLLSAGMKSTKSQ